MSDRQGRFRSDHLTVDAIVRMFAINEGDEALLREAFAAVAARVSVPANPEAPDLAGFVTRYMMGDGFIRVNNWMMKGWRDTMYDEGVALWTDILAAALLNSSLASQPVPAPEPPDLTDLVEEDCRDAWREGYAYAAAVLAPVAKRQSNERSAEG